jgi:hypothetical protein
MAIGPTRESAAADSTEHGARRRAAVPCPPRGPRVARSTRPSPPRSCRWRLRRGSCGSRRHFPGRRRNVPRVDIPNMTLLSFHWADAGICGRGLDGTWCATQSCPSRHNRRSTFATSQSWTSSRSSSSSCPHRTRPKFHRTRSGTVDIPNMTLLSFHWADAGICGRGLDGTRELRFAQTLSGKEEKRPAGQGRLHEGLAEDKGRQFHRTRSGTVDIPNMTLLSFHWADAGICGRGLDGRHFPGRRRNVPRVRDGYTRASRRTRDGSSASRTMFPVRPDGQVPQDAIGYGRHPKHDFAVLPLGRRGNLRPRLRRGSCGSRRHFPGRRRNVPRVRDGYTRASRRTGSAT